MEIARLENLFVFDVPAAYFGYVIECIFELPRAVVSLSVVLIKKNGNAED
jgi:hypothetical protein